MKFWSRNKRESDWLVDTIRYLIYMYVVKCLWLYSMYYFSAIHKLFLPIYYYVWKSHKLSLTDENQGMKLASLLPRFSRHLLQLLGYCFRKVWKACVWKKTVLEWVSSLPEEETLLPLFSIFHSCDYSLMGIRNWNVNYWKIGDWLAQRQMEIRKLLGCVFF